MNKRGQFFLLAAIVIIGVIMGLRAIYTNVETPPEDSSIYDLSEEIHYESGAVIDSGVFFAFNENERNRRIENLTDYYAAANLGTDFIIVYGDRDKLWAVFYTTQNTGSVGLTLGSGSANYNVTTQRRFNATFVPAQGDNSVTIVLDEVSYTFDLSPGQTFFIVLKKERQGEQFVSASKDK
jgi:hypothetical protein